MSLVATQVLVTVTGVEDDGCGVLDRPQFPDGAGNIAADELSRDSATTAVAHIDGCAEVPDGLCEEVHVEPELQQIVLFEARALLGGINDLREVDRDDVKGGAEGERRYSWVAEVQSCEGRRREVGDRADRRSVAGTAKDGNRIELLAGRELDTDLMDLFRVAGVRVDVGRRIAEREQTVGAVGVSKCCHRAKQAIRHRIGRWLLEAVTDGHQCCSCEVDQCTGAEDAAVISSV